MWVGHGASAKERENGILFGQKYCEDAGHPSWARIVKVYEDAEPALFTQNFSDWHVEDEADSLASLSYKPERHIAAHQ